MKSINVALLIVASLLIGACSHESLPDLTTLNESVSSNEKAIKRYIEQYHPVKSRSNTPLVPIVQNGDTVAYLANYDEGWELFSNNTSLPMVLMKSKKGNFYPNTGLLSNESKSSFLDFYNSLIGGLSIYPEKEDTHTTWSLYSDEGDRDVLQYPKWVGLAASVVKETYTPKGGRLKTQWNQRGNYNLFTPFYKDATNVHSPLGCGAVAVGQMIFHSNKYFGVPTTTVSKASYNSYSNQYYFYEPSSTAWSLMDSGEDPLFCEDPQKMETTAAFLGNIAVNIYTNFGEQNGKGSGSSPSNYIPFLRATLNIKLTEANKNWYDIIHTLKLGYPVIADSYSPEDGHTYLIDRADYIRTDVYDVFDIRSTDNNPYIENTEDTEDPDDSLEFVAHSLDYYKEAYGDIDYNLNSILTERWLMMNWGGTKSLNEVMINADDKIIEISTYKFDTHYIYKVTNN